MKSYHGSTKKIERWKLDQGNEYGIYFTTDIDFAKAYGQEINEAELNFTNLLDATPDSNLEVIMNIIPELADLANEDIGDELSVSEIIEDESNLCFELLQDSSLKIDSENYLREVFVKRAQSAGYDGLLITDYTDGDEHDAYIVLSLNAIN